MSAPANVSAIQVVLVCVLAAVLYSCLTNNTPAPVAPTVPTAKPVETAAQQLARLHLEEKRQRFIEKAIAGGLIQRVDSNGELWVAPAFYSLAFDDKETLCSVVYAWRYGQDRTEFLALRDSRSGKRIGRFTVSGLDLD